MSDHVHTYIRIDQAFAPALICVECGESAFERCSDRGCYAARCFMCGDRARDVEQVKLLRAAMAERVAR